MWWDRILSEAKSFFQSGLFFILLGDLIMYFGYRLSQDPFTHSAFVFLVVILGLALLLFGTGTSASGEGTSGQIKVAIAGGAGVLAMVLGFGVAYLRTAHRAHRRFQASTRLRHCRAFDWRNRKQRPRRSRQF